MIGSQFQGVDGQSLSIQDVLNNDDLTAGWDASIAAQIQIRDGNTFVEYFLCDEVENPDWDESDPNSPDIITAWVARNNSSIPATIKINPGQGFWFKNPNAVDITTAGQVVSQPSYEKTLVANTWALVANPYPMGLRLNKGVDAWAADYLTAGWDAGIAAQIQIRDGNTFVEYFLCDEVENPDWDENDPTSLDIITAWVARNNSSVPTNLEIPVMNGFWLKNPTATTVYFNK